MIPHAFLGLILLYLGSTQIVLFSLAFNRGLECNIKTYSIRQTINISYKIAIALQNQRSFTTNAIAKTIIFSSL